MTTYHYDPRVLESAPWDDILIHSNDPIRKVGCILCVPGHGEFTGVNWTDISENNKWFWKDNRDLARKLVRHAEVDAILAAIDSNVTDFSEATLIVTLSPCVECRAIIERLNIKECFYGEEYLPRV